MTTGVSTACLYPQNTEEALLSLAGLGVKAVEVFVNAGCELGRDYLLELRKTADDSGVRILSLHPFTAPIEPLLFFSGYERRFNEGRELYKGYYEAANILGASCVVFHGSSRYVDISYEEYFERFGLLAEEAAASGNKLCHENVERCTGYRPQFFSEMAKALPDARFIFDIKQAVRAGEDVFRFAQAMGDRIEHIHFSDNTGNESCLLPGNGTFNTLELLYTVRKNGFNGGVIVELYRENFGGIVELYEGYQRLFTQVSTVLKNAETNDTIRQTPL